MKTRGQDSLALPNILPPPLSSRCKQGEQDVDKMRKISFLDVEGSSKHLWVQRYQDLGFASETGMSLVPQFAGSQLCWLGAKAGALHQESQTVVLISSPLLMSVQVSMALPHSEGSRASCHHANRDTNLQTHCLGIPAIVA